MQHHRALGVASLRQCRNALLDRSWIIGVELTCDLLTHRDALQLRVLATQTAPDNAAQHISPTANGEVRLLEGCQLRKLQRLRIGLPLLGLLVRLRRDAEQGLDDFCHVLLLR